MESFERTREDILLVVTTLQQLGFSVNLGKSSLVPSIRILHLGTVIDSRLGKVFLSPDRKVSLLTLVRQVRRQCYVSMAVLSSLLGKFISCIDVVPRARLHTRALQWRLLPHQRSNSSNSVAKAPVTPQVQLSLKWWLSPALHKGCEFREPERLTLMMDASLYRWGALLESQMTQGR